MERAERILVGCFMVGLMFKRMHWPGCAVVLVSAAGGLNVLYFSLGIGLFGVPKPGDR